MTRLSETRRLLSLLMGIVIAGTIGAAYSVAASSDTQRKMASSKPGASAKAQSKTPAQMVLEPKAMDLLKAASTRLAEAKSMSFTARAGYEYPSQLGPPIVYTVQYNVTMQRPDKLKVLSPGDGPASEFYYNGNSMMALAPAANLVAVSDAPPTIEGALKAAFDNAAIYFPFTDLLVADPYAALTDGAILAFYIGQADTVGGVKTDMVAWANKDVFLQIWIGADDKLPRRVRAIYSADPLVLRHELDLSDWQLDPAIPPDAFTSAQAKTAQRIDFAQPTTAAPPPGVKPLSKTASSKSDGKPRSNTP
jgi:hypothetical protein